MPHLDSYPNHRAKIEKVQEDFGLIGREQNEGETSESCSDCYRHQPVSRLRMRVQISRITQYRQKTENMDTQYFNMENPNREKPRGPQTLRK